MWLSSNLCFFILAVTAGHARIIPRAHPVPDWSFFGLADNAAGEILPLTEANLARFNAENPPGPYDNMLKVWRWLDNLDDADMMMPEYLSASEAESAQLGTTREMNHIYMDEPTEDFPGRSARQRWWDEHPGGLNDLKFAEENIRSKPVVYPPEIPLPEDMSGSSGSSDRSSSVDSAIRTGQITPLEESEYARIRWIEPVAPEGSDVSSYMDIGEALQYWGRYLLGRIAAVAAELFVNVVNPMFIVADAVTIPLMLWDLIAATVPYHYGKCDMGNNTCIADDGQKHYDCQPTYSCKAQGDVCGYRTVKPAKVVCDWTLYQYWIQSAHLSPLKAAYRAEKANFHQHKYEKLVTKGEDLKYQQLQCGDDKCRKKLGDKIKDYEAKIEDEATRADMMKDKGEEKKAIKYWQKSVHITKDLDVATKRYNLAVHMIDKVRFAGSSMVEHSVKKLEDEFRDAEKHMEKHNKRLLDTLRKARDHTIKADPIGVGKLLVQGQANLNDTMFRNMTMWPGHGR